MANRSQLPINDPTVKTLSLVEIIHQLHAGNYGLLLEAGFSLEQLDMIRGMQFQDLTVLTGSSKLKVTVQIDPESLEQCFTTMENEKTHRRLKEYWVINGAKPDQLRRYFSMSNQDVRIMREFLGVCLAEGRAPKLETDTLIRIGNNYQVIRGAFPDIREALVELHKTLPHIGLSILITAVEQLKEAKSEVPLKYIARN